LNLSWSEFRENFLGPTDPASAPAGSLRGTLFSKWKDLGLAAQPTTSNNGVHASASPLEALVERCNWLGCIYSSDIYGKELMRSGILLKQLHEWSADPQVTWRSGGIDQTSSIFDALEGLDADRCLVRCQMIADVPLLGSVAPTAGGQSPGGAMVAVDGMCGHLWKKKPPAMFQLKKFQWRYVYLADAKLHWVEPGKNADNSPDKFKNSIDFSVNRCVVEEVEGDPSKFTVKETSGAWSQCSSFTGAQDSRDFTFDAADSDYNRAAWVAGIEKQLEMGATRRGASQVDQL